jgi:hypothetical protein
MHTTAAPASPPPDHPVYRRLGANLARLRERASVTTAELADASERYPTAVLEGAEARGVPLLDLDLGALARMGELLGVDPADLLAAAPVSAKPRERTRR